MTTTSTPTTFSDLYTDAGNRLRVNVSDTTTLTILKRFINQGNHDVHIQQNWPWAERVGMLQTHATYTDGTVAIALSARTTVTGTTTLWNTAVTGMGFNNARVGGKMTFEGDTDVYTVSAVGSDTSITLADRYIGATALTAATYKYYEDEYALASDFWRTIDLRKFSDNFPLPIIERQEFYRRVVRNSTTNTPRICTLIDLGPSTTVASRPRIVLHPAPEQVYNIAYRYITTNLAISSAGAGQTNLSADADEPIIPLRYRHVLVAYAVGQWYRDRKDDVRSQEAMGEYVDLIRRMAGDVFPEKDKPRFHSNRMAYARGASGYRSRGRYTTGTAFDEMRD